ncbi:hypothetical protein BDF14DRAFT_369564 [Spinellus fusiger]|nr:hypothetical protein BDF14DRAFT_369564 [Spinellus fusiger]
MRQSSTAWMVLLIGQLQLHVKWQLINFQLGLRQVHNGTLYKIYRICNQPSYLPLAEQTAISYTIQPIFNHLLLPYAHLFNTKWIEVSNDFTGSTKIDGLGTLKGSREILLIIEFAGENISSMAKYNSNIKKIYENALKAIKQSGRNKIFTVLYFNNLIYYEVLLKFKKQYV